MTTNQSRIDDLVARPSEGLSVEIKRWIDPDLTDGVAKIAKACIALRNRNGGFLMIGFDDDTLLPDDDHAPEDVRAKFNLDKIQGIVSNYASESFEVELCFGRRDDREYPVIVIPNGIRTPVAAKRDLTDSMGRSLIRKGDVYFRTLGSNGTPSSSSARPDDWHDIVEICFENREADIGRFLRRHLAGSEISGLLESLTELKSGPAPPVPTLRDRALVLLDRGERLCSVAILEKERSTAEAVTLNGGAWSVAFVIDPSRADSLPSAEFLNTVMSANPQYTGWPVWLDSRGFRDQASAPRVISDGWQALIVSLVGWSKHVDFMRLEPKGEFYLWRLLQDDLTDEVQPGAALDGILVLIRVAEAIAVGLSIARALGRGTEARLGFAFRWTKLAGRELTSWANPMVSFSSGRKAYQDTATTFVEIPLETPVSAIAPYVEEATRGLFVLFDGYSISSEAVENWTQRLVERRLGPR